MKRKNRGSSLDRWLREEGICEEVTSAAIKRVLARQLEAAMRQKNVSRSEMARQMRTSRAALNRLLDPEKDSVTLTRCAWRPLWSDGKSGWNWFEGLPGNRTLLAAVNVSGHSSTAYFAPLPMRDLRVSLAGNFHNARALRAAPPSEFPAAAGELRSFRPFWMSVI